MGHLRNGGTFHQNIKWQSYKSWLNLDNITVILLTVRRFRPVITFCQLSALSPDGETGSHAAYHMQRAPMSTDGTNVFVTLPVKELELRAINLSSALRLVSGWARIHVIQVCKVAKLTVFPHGTHRLRLVHSNWLLWGENGQRKGVSAAMCSETGQAKRGQGGSYEIQVTSRIQIDCQGFGTQDRSWRNNPQQQPKYVQGRARARLAGLNTQQKGEVYPTPMGCPQGWILVFPSQLGCTNPQ